MYIIDYIYIYIYIHTYTYVNGSAITSCRRPARRTSND